MNREIEFRIWADNQFYYKCLIGNTNDTTDDNWTCPMVWLEDKKEWVHCDNGIISQFTGLTDKNGKKIFEGDIIHHVSIIEEANYEVIFNKGAFYGKRRNVYLKDEYVYLSLKLHQNKIEVIGNIYEDNLESEVN